MLYKDIPTVYRWDKKSKWWVHMSFQYAALYMYLPKIQNGFYLRRLLCYRRGSTSFEDLKTIDNVRSMTRRWQLNYREWGEVLLEASYERMPYHLQLLFDTILIYSFPDSPRGLWERFKSDLSEDFQREMGMDADDRKVEFKTQKSLHLWNKINLKVGTPTIMIRNLYSDDGLYVFEL
ncbi:Helitron helicase [Phytophthora megakarya]|uniref:Helitron helicase n=1 Tax=Phytophthora megakarya TaxID=4795 RepID=A0A225WYL4_9STRA|nr:Helitron helicase [Phytophthora megakarya]